MAYSETGTATDHNDLVVKIVTFVTATLPTAERHVANRNTTEANTLGDLANEKVVLLQAPGLAAADQIFYGMKVYKSVASDYYNMQINAFTGYVPGNLFEAQPGNSMGAGSTGIGVTLWNQSIPYWLNGDGQHFSCVAKIQNSYVAFGTGFLLKYATFSQWPYPMYVFGNLASSSATRYSDVNWVSGWKGNRANLRLRDAAGAWLTPRCLPYENTQNIRNTVNLSGTATGYYGLHPIELSDTTGTGNVYGMMDGLFYVSGFNNAAENTETPSGGVAHVVVRDGTKTGNNDYIAIKMV